MTKAVLKYLLISVWIITAAAVFVFVPAFGEPKDKSEHHDQASKNYDFRFGKDRPFAPGNATTFNSRFIDPKYFVSSARCATCHTDIHPQWSESAHAKAFVEPFYQKNVQDLQNQKNIAFTRHCESCHNPAALFSGALTDKPFVKERPFDNDGVSCIVCHSIESVSGRGIGGYVMGQPALIQETDGTKVLNATDEDIVNDIPGHKRAMMRDLLKKPEFCASCHKSQVPKELNDYKFLRAFMVGDEYQRASFSKETPHPFYTRDKETCNSCHMKKVPTENYDVSVKDGTIKSHRYAAANTAIPLVYGYKRQFEEVTAFLKDDKIFIDIFALHRQAAGSSRTRTIAPINRKSFRLKSGDTLTADVVITNKNIGHSFPPELRDFYEAFIEFEVAGTDGKTLFKSGYLDPEGFLDKSAHNYKTYLVFENGKLNDLHHIWKTRVVGQNNQIQSGRSDVSRYRFVIPSDFKGDLVLTAKLNYRRFTKVFSDYVIGNSEMLPIVTMAQTSERLSIGSKTSSSDLPRSMPDWWRWNNYGIALLDNKQFPQAAKAFDEVIDFKNDYQSTAYANRALALIEVGDWQGAKKLIDKSLKLNPDNYRSIFQRGRVNKVYSKLEDAKQDYLTVLEKYPNDRATLQQLGELAKLESEDAEAEARREMLVVAEGYYNRILEIDPEDLGAIYNLMLIYQKLGKRDLAAAKSVEFRDLKDDTQVAFLAARFLQENDEIGNESVPYHVHDLLPFKFEWEGTGYPTIAGIDWNRRLKTTADFGVKKGR